MERSPPDVLALVDASVTGVKLLDAEASAADPSGAEPALDTARGADVVVLSVTAAGVSDSDADMLLLLPKLTPMAAPVGPHWAPTE